MRAVVEANAKDLHVRVKSGVLSLYVAPKSGLQAGEHKGKMGVHRGILHDDWLWSLDAHRCKVPQRTDTCPHQTVCHVLSLQDRHGEDGYLHALSFDTCGQLIDVIDGHASHFRADDLLCYVEACRDLQPELTKPFVRQKPRSEATHADEEGVMTLCEA